MTGNSFTESVNSANNSILQENIKLGQLPLKLIFCLTLIAFALMPIISGIIVYKLKPETNIFLVTIQKNEQGIKIDVAKSMYHFGLENQKFGEIIIAQNDTNPMKCIIMNGKNETVFINVDFTDQESWRVSSPVDVKSYRHPSIYIRHTDIANLNIFEYDIVGFFTDDLDKVLKILHKKFSCSSKSLIYSKLGEFNKMQSTKVLHGNGILKEYVDLQPTCYSDGFNCDDLFSQNSLFPLQCSNLSFDENPLFFSLEGKKQNVKLLEFKGHYSNDYCCKNDTRIVQFYGDYCQQNLLAGCNFSEAFNIGKCDKFNLINHSSLCFHENCFITLSYKTSCDSSLIPIGKCNPKYQCL